MISGSGLPLLADAPRAAVGEVADSMLIFLAGFWCPPALALEGRTIRIRCQVHCPGSGAGADEFPLMWNPRLRGHREVKNLTHATNGHRDSTRIKSV